MGSWGCPWRGLIPSITSTAGQDADAPRCVPPAGGALLQNGQTTAEIQEEVALTNLGSSSGASKRHSAADKMHFPRANLQTITTLGTLGHDSRPETPGCKPPSQKSRRAGGSEGPAAAGLPKFALLICCLLPLCPCRQGGVW